MMNSSDSEEKNKKHLLSSKFEVLSDMEGVVADLMQKHEEKRELWFPSDFLPADETTNEELYLTQVRERAKGIPLSGRVALALNLITEEGLPHFHRLIAGTSRERLILEKLELFVDSGRGSSRQCYT